MVAARRDSLIMLVEDNVDVRESTLMLLQQIVALQEAMRIQLTVCPKRRRRLNSADYLSDVVACWLPNGTCERHECSIDTVLL